VLGVVVLADIFLFLGDRMPDAIVTRARTHYQ
jgi:hypothetical protein